jgi:cell division protein FtsW
VADRAAARRSAVGRGSAGRAVTPKRRTGRAPERTSTRTTKLRVVRSPARRPRKDPAVAARTSVILLLVSAALLTTIGVVEVFSASSVYAFTNYDNSFWFLERQAIYAAIGIGALLLTARMRYGAWRRLSGPLVAISVVLLLIALHPTAGSSVYGASRWIGLGPLTLQPSEFAKLALIAFTAAILAQKEGKLDDWLHLALPLGPVVLLVAAIVMLQRDLGTTIVIVGSVLMMLFVGGARLRHLVVTGVVSMGGLAYLIFGTAYRRARFLSFFDPWKDPLSHGYQLIQGLIALGSGGWFGVGLGASRQKWAYLPNAHTDFIFAVLGEELGLLGEFVVLILFGAMIYAGIRIAVRAPDTFGRLLAAGITSWIGLQAIVNLGAVTGLLPITGVPLPFVSFGGSALIVTLGAVGVLASIARAGGASRAGTASGTTSRAGERKEGAGRSRTSTRRTPA